MIFRNLPDPPPDYVEGIQKQISWQLLKQKKKKNVKMQIFRDFTPERRLGLYKPSNNNNINVIDFSIFQEFLKKEFSHENIYFWTACERYRKIKGDDEDSVKVRMVAAEEIIKRHLSSGAPEPVNVDSHARQAAQEGPPTSHLFATAQKQIYNLMKFDSFSRFLKSELYKDSLGKFLLPFFYLFFFLVKQMYAMSHFVLLTNYFIIFNGL